ncbi:MAG: hypothetical protein BWY57_03248 [Betaproteobacteria bacterium ADurb.Bin341]|nr:MAG: hypothetical protein BWY57_03248 [Betaproteobacteria bacterium ADurb.Bin341]
MGEKAAQVIVGFIQREPGRRWARLPKLTQERGFARSDRRQQEVETRRHRAQTRRQVAAEQRGVAGGGRVQLGDEDALVK